MEPRIQYAKIKDGVSASIVAKPDGRLTATRSADGGGRLQTRLQQTGYNGPSAVSMGALLCGSIRIRSTTS